MNQIATGSLQADLSNDYLADEADLLDKLLPTLGDYPAQAITQRAESLATAVRNKDNSQSLLKSFLQEYHLSTQEGIVLMGIAEALLRIPDTATQDLFLQEKLTEANWQQHLDHSESWLVNLSTQALLMTHRVEKKTLPNDQQWSGIVDAMIARMGVPLIRTALKQATEYLAYQFVIADNIESAWKKAQKYPQYRYSFDMLGEAAISAEDAQRYFEDYQSAIAELAKHANPTNLHNGPSISVKLSALCPRYEPHQNGRAVPEISQKLLSLAIHAKDAGIALTIDAEESERLAMSLNIFANVFNDPVCKDWPGFGLAVQSYQKRAYAVTEWLAMLAKRAKRQIPVRLVKGAYWDSEIKRAQEKGLNHYPVFTQKSATDTVYLICAKRLLESPMLFYPQFASHNAHTIAAISEIAQHHDYEFQRLFGMGEKIYNELMAGQDDSVPCRVYAPVGLYQDLLPYLVRRLLENGANTSFLNQLENNQIEVNKIIADPIVQLKTKPHSTSPIPLPKDLFSPQRVNSQGVNVADIQILISLQRELDTLANQQWQAYPIVNGQPISGPLHKLENPGNHHSSNGTVIEADKDIITKATDQADKAFPQWRKTPIEQRASYLHNAADLLETHRLELASLCIREGGKTILDALSEIREAIDFCRYYASIAEQQFALPVELPGPTGEQNLLFQNGRGVFLCISPWNFPAAIFLGQITAALVAGNTVIAKPAEQTPLIAMRCIEILYQAGIPLEVLQFLPGNGPTIGHQVLNDQRLAGVAFTGSTATAQIIHQSLANQQKIIPLIAETGGQNVMITDSSALAEQVVKDAIYSAFNSAGQRCSALRVLYLQQEMADKIISMLIGAMRELVIGNPANYATDIGPVIDQTALQSLHDHVVRMQQEARILYHLPLPVRLPNGYYFAPCLIELDTLKQLTHEIFGPVLHIIRYPAQQLEQVIDDINTIGFGLTLGIHSRIDTTINLIKQRARVGNIYVNRNMIGAVVGVQPFGGMGLSGTGPKAGGPNYLQHFSVEQTVTINTAAVGGNALLMTQNLT